jgi:hypothetical protein
MRGGLRGGGVRSDFFINKKLTYTNLELIILSPSQNKGEY